MAYSVNLPSYDEHACERFERQADRLVNDQAFSKAVADLSTTLNIIGIGGRSRQIALHLREFYPAMDHDRRGRSRFEADMWERSFRGRTDLLELCYRDSYLQLKLAPATIAGLMSRMPNPVNIDCSFWNNERRRPNRRRQLRTQFAEQLETLIPPKLLKTFNLNFVNTEPSNSNFVDEHRYRSRASSSSYGSSNSFFATDQLPPDGYDYDDEKRDERLNGVEPSTSKFRTKPTLELEALFLAAASAASQMPMLRHMRVGLEIFPAVERISGLDDWNLSTGLRMI